MKTERQAVVPGLKNNNNKILRSICPGRTKKLDLKNLIHLKMN